MMLYTIERFNQSAVKKNLSAGAILLWQHLFFTMQRRNQFCEMQQNTAVLMASLSVSRQGLQLMRQSLVERGFLEVRVDEHQQTFYTLLIDGKAVGDKGEQAECTKAKDRTAGAGFPVLQAMDTAKLMAGTPTPHDHVSYPSGDIILTNKVRPYIEKFCDKFGPAMRADLLNWAEMRRKNGWTLTLWGLEIAFKNLIELSGGDVFLMGKIAAQSVEQRWKSFWPIEVKAKPSGAKLRAMEAKEAGNAAGDTTQTVYKKSWQKSAPAPKFKPEGRDLSFLER